MKINLSQYNLRKVEQTIIEVSTLAKRITLENITNICLISFAIHVMKEENLQDIFLVTKIDLKRGKETRKEIMLMLQNMMSLPRRESNKKVMKNMF